MIADSSDGVVRDEWLVRVQKSSAKQQVYFGGSAWRPYIRAFIPTFLVVNDVLIKRLIEASYDNEPLKDGIKCVKYISLQAGEAWTFQFSKIMKDRKTGKWWFEGFINVEV